MPDIIIVMITMMTIFKPLIIVLTIIMLTILALPVEISNLSSNITVTQEDTSNLNNSIDPPELLPIGDKTLGEGEPLNFSLNVSGGSGYELQYSCFNLPEGALFDDEMGVFSWKPDYEQTGEYCDVRFEVQDGSEVDYEDICIVVEDVWPRWDVDMDGIVGKKDYLIVLDHYEEVVDVPGPRYDVNCDRIVNRNDIKVILRHRGEVVNPEPRPEPTSMPTAMPTAMPTSVPTSVPTVEPTAEPTPTPTPEPSELTISSNDGLKLTFDEDGGIKGVSIDDTEMPMLDILGGFSFNEISSTSDQNLVANAGFDNVSDSVPLNWSFIKGAGTVEYDGVEGYDSPGSVRIEVPGIVDEKSGFPKSDLIDAEPDRLYTFSAWGKSEGVNGKYAPAVRVVEIDSDGKRITQHSLTFSRDSGWEEKNIGFTTCSNTRRLYVYVNIWKSYGTFWVDDVMLETFKSEKVPLDCTIVKNQDGSITQYVTESEIDFKFDYILKDRYIEIHGDIQDLSGVDRALQMRFELPVNATGWEWGDYIRKSREIEEGERYENVYKIGDVRTQNTYPFTFVGRDEYGLSLGIPIDVPRIYRIAYSTGNGHSIEYDFGLANCTDKIGAGHANFTFILYKVDEPEWGFRAGAKKYYELYPEFFVKKNDKEGLWICGIDPSNVTNNSDFGFAFEDAHYLSASNRIFDIQNDMYPMQYTEPWGIWINFKESNGTEPSYDEKIEALSNYNNSTGNWRNVVTKQIAVETILNTAPYDENGKQYLDFWIQWTDWSLSYPTNPDPDLPSPNRYDISYMKYLLSNESGLFSYNWSLGTNCSISPIAYSGNYSCKIEIPDSIDIISGNILSSVMNVTPSTQYNLSVWGKTKNCGGTYTPSVRVVEYYSNETMIKQNILRFDFGTNDWTEKNTTFITSDNVDYLLIYANIYKGYGTFWIDDIQLIKNNTSNNLIRDCSFENTFDMDDYQCAGLRLDAFGSSGFWPKKQNFRKEHWKYTDYPLVFDYSTKQPVILGTLSQYEFLKEWNRNMSAMDKRIDANIDVYAYSFYGNLIDVFGNEVWTLHLDDNKASLGRTMAYNRTIRNLLQWSTPKNDMITNEEMEIYINNQMFYGMFPSISGAGFGYYWDNATLYERDRALFKKYIPIIKNISATGWEPIPYAVCDNSNIIFERYGRLDESLYYTIANSNFTEQGSVLSIDLLKLGYSDTTVEVKELVTNVTSIYNIEDGKVFIEISELLPHETLVYEII